MANILSNFEGWGPTEVAYIKKRSVFLNYFRLRTEGVLPAPASQSLIILILYAKILGCMQKTSFACGFTSIERRTIYDLWKMSYAALRKKKGGCRNFTS